MLSLRELVSELNIELSDKQLESFDTYYKMLIEWNEKINLTAITEYDEVLVKHFTDSLSIVKAVDMNRVTSLIDVGTGGGFPGIPIAILFPEIKITLLDSLNKRITFLNEVVKELSLTNVEAIHGRAEDIARGDYREKFDLCVSRAVANLSTLSELCIPFVSVGGFFVSYKSEKADEEIESATKAIDILGGKIVNKIDFAIKDNNRNLIVIEKISATAKKYPRKAGTPSKQPL